MVNFLFINVDHNAGFMHYSNPVPLSEAYILAYLKSLGYGGEILDDTEKDPLPLRALEKRIHQLEPSVIGFTAYQCNMERIRFIAHYVKTHHENVRVLLGGPQAIRMPSAALEELKDIDIICREEGEIVAAAIGEGLKKDKPLSSVHGITLRENGKIIDTDLLLDLPEDLDHYPSPYLDGTIDLKGRSIATLLTSRGCKYGCLFCITPSTSHGRIRHHSARRVLDEMECLEAAGVRLFWFADPNFTVSREKTLEILHGKMARGIETPFWCTTRADLVDLQILKDLREAGAETVAFGLESGDPGIQRTIRKGIDLEQLSQVVEHTQSLGMKAELYSIYGLPGETIDQARQTLDFVKACEVPIESNSHAQQMQLYFGSVYERNPRKYGFDPLPFYRPAYISVGDQYETESLTKQGIRRIRSLWALASEKIRLDVNDPDRCFEILDFLLRNEEDLDSEQAFYEYGAIASCHLEEKQLLWRFLNRYIKRLHPDESRLNQIISRLGIFQETQRGANSTSRIILDCHSEMDGVPFSGMKAGYGDITLGHNLYLTDFEKNLIGVRAGKEIAFEFTFPEDYFSVELRGKTAGVWAKVLAVLNPVRAKTLKQLKSLGISNHYYFPDLDRLQQESEFLYYLALKSIPKHDLVQLPSHFLMLTYHYAKLHKMADIRRMTQLLASDKSAFEAVGDMLRLAGRYLEAARYYGRAGASESRMKIKQARSYLLGDEAQRALEVLNSMPENSDPEFLELMLDCLKVAEPDSERIPPLDDYILHQKVESALANNRIGAECGVLSEAD